MRNTAASHIDVSIDILFMSPKGSFRKAKEENKEAGEKASVEHTAQLVIDRERLSD